MGLIPAGGGCKEMLARWLNTNEAKEDPNFAPLKVFDIIGYGKTATSPIEAEPLKYLLPENKKIMNRNSLLEVSKNILNENKDFSFLVVLSISLTLPEIVPFNPSLAMIIVPLIWFEIRNFCKKTLFFFKDLTFMNL